VTFMAGPALVALIGSLASASAALATSGLIGLVGTLAVAVHPAVGGKPAPSLATSNGTSAPTTVTRPSVRSAPLTTLVSMAFLFLTAIVIVEVSVVAFAAHHHASHQAGLLLATWSSGSLTGGLVLGARAARTGARRVGPLMLCAAGGFALLAAAPGVGPLYALLFVAGVAIAPGFSCIYDLVGRTTPPEVAVEAFSWVASAIQLGAAVGAAVGGVLVQNAGTRTAMLCAGLVGAGPAAVGFLGRRLLGREHVGVAAAG